MGAPGTYIEIIAEASTPDGDATTGRLFAIGTTTGGPSEPTTVRSYRDFESVFGARANHTTLPDAVRAFFVYSRNVGEIVVSRVVSSDASAATVMLTTSGDNGPDDVIRVDATSIGEDGNSLVVDVEGSGSSRDVILTDDGETVQTWRDLDSVEEIVAALNQSPLVTATDLALEGAPLPDSDSYELSGGDDANDSVTDEDWKEALDRITGDLGAGQVAMPGRYSGEAHTALVEHAQEHVRTAYLDAPPEASRADLESLSSNADEIFALWFPKWVLTALGSRHVRVPGSVVAAGLTAAADERWPTAHMVPAGVTRGTIPGAIDIVGPKFTSEADREALNDVGMNLAISDARRGTVLFGFRNSTGEGGQHSGLAPRVAMSIAAQVQVFALGFEFDPLNAARVADYENGVLAILDGFADAGAIVAGEGAYEVTAFADGLELTCDIEFQPVGFAERIVNRLVVRFD